MSTQSRLRWTGGVGRKKGTGIEWQSLHRSWNTQSWKVMELGNRVKNKTKEVEADFFCKLKARVDKQSWRWWVKGENTKSQEIDSYLKSKEQSFFEQIKSTRELTVEWITSEQEQGGKERCARGTEVGWVHKGDGLRWGRLDVKKMCTVQMRVCTKQPVGGVRVRATLRAETMVVEIRSSGVKNKSTEGVEVEIEIRLRLVLRVRQLLEREEGEGKKGEEEAEGGRGRGGRKYSREHANRDVRLSLTRGTERKKQRTQRGRRRGRRWSRKGVRGGGVHEVRRWGRWIRGGGEARLEVKSRSNKIEEVKVEVRLAL
ncbi:hypothetical protein PMAC_001660, partial [Pneumocystis sp. 'macacae']